MKKILLVLLAVVMFLFLVVLGCSKNAPAGPLGVNKIQQTYTPSATPNAVFKVLVSEAGTPVPSVVVQIAPQGVTILTSVTTDATGAALFTVHSGGKWDINVPGQNGYDSLFYTVEPLSNTVYAIELGTQNIQLELVSGEANLAISPTTLHYRATYHCDKSKQYNITLQGVPGSLSVTASNTLVRNNNEEVSFFIDVPKSYEGISTIGTYLYVSAVAAQGGRVLASNATLVKRNWNFVVSADVKFAKTFVGSGAVDPSPGYTLYWIGSTNYNIDAQNFVTTGSVKKAFVAYSTWGSIASINWVIYNSNSIDDGEGYYDNLVEIGTKAGYDWVMDHNDANGSITIHFYDDLYLDVERTFQVSDSFGNVCGHYRQICYEIWGSEFDKCTNYPASFGCFYATLTMHRSRSGNVYGQ